MAKVPLEFDQSTEFVRPMTAVRRIDIKSYTSSNPYIAPSDGYVNIKTYDNAAGATRMSLAGTYLSYDVPKGLWNSMFVKKNTDMWITASTLSNCEVAYFNSIS